MHLSSEAAVKRLGIVYDITFKNLAWTEPYPEEDIEDLGFVYREKLRIARRILDRVGGCEWGGHPAYGDVTVAVKRNATEEERKRWDFADDEINRLYDKIRGE